VTLYYFEQKGLDGWHPATSSTLPAIKKVNGKLFLNRADGLGKRIRVMPVVVNPGHEKCSLAQLREVYSADGKFRGQSPAPATDLSIEDDGFVTVQTTSAAP
jgi:hypothetical protein